MPYETIPETDAYKPDQDLPQHLDHKPVFAVPYQKFDGPDAGDTDVKYISVGLAQWNHDEISVKTMRHVGRKWTRQAEELPLHRPIDMTILLAKALFDAQNGAVTLLEDTLAGQKHEIKVTAESRSFGEMASYNQAVSTISPIIKERLNALLTVLADLKQSGKI